METLLPYDYEGTTEKGQYPMRPQDRGKPKKLTDWKATVDSCFKVPEVPDFTELKRLRRLSK